MSSENVHDVTGFNNLQELDIRMNDPMRAGVHSLWEQDLFMDYKIKVGDQEFNVHKVIVASMSDYFRAMLSGGMAEGEQNSVSVEGVSAGVMKILINYIYTNHMNISDDSAATVLGGAVYFQIKSAIKPCTSFIVDKLDPDNWFDILTLFESYGLTDAVKEVKAYAKRDITDIAKVDNAKFPYEELYFIVENWQSSEYDLFSFIQKWIKADKEERKPYADKLLCSVRFSLMTPRELNEMQNMKDYCGIPNSWYSLIDKALEYHKLPLHQRVLEDSDQSKVRSAPSFVLLSQGNSESVGYFLEPRKEKCFLEHQGLKMPSECGDSYRSQIVVNNFLIVCTRQEYCVHQFYIFDPRSLQWEKMAQNDRSVMCSFLRHDNKHLYVFCDLRFPDIVNSILQYKFHTNEWSEFSTLPVLFMCFAACVLENGLYSCGGYDYINDVMYRLDLSSHEWETKTRVSEPGFITKMHGMKFCGRKVISIIHNDDQMSLYHPEGGGHWEEINFIFDLPPKLKLTSYEWAWGNSIFMLEHIYNGDGAAVIGCQMVSFPEHSPYDPVVENYEGYPSDGYGTVLAIPPYTRELGFGL